MKLIRGKELLFIEGFTAYLTTMLDALHRTSDAEMVLRRTDGAQIQVGDDYCDIVAHLEITLKHDTEDEINTAEVLLTSSISSDVYAIALSLYHTDNTNTEHKCWRDWLYAPSEKNTAVDVGEVVATAVWQFLRSEQNVPESVEFLQECVDACQE